MPVGYAFAQIVEFLNMMVIFIAIKRDHSHSNLKGLLKIAYFYNNIQNYTITKVAKTGCSELASTFQFLVESLGVGLIQPGRGPDVLITEVPGSLLSQA